MKRPDEMAEGSREPPGSGRGDAGAVDDRGRQGRLSDKGLYRAVLLAAFLLAAGLLFQQLVTLLVAVLITVIVAIPPAALADRLERVGVPRWIGALIGMLALVAVLVGVLWLVISPLVEQIQAFVEELPQIVDSAIERLASLTGARPARIGEELQGFVQRYVDRPQLLVGEVASIGLSVLLVLAGLVFVLITAYYMAVRPDPLVHSALRLFPPERREWALALIGRLHESWVGWLKGVGVDMVVTGVLLYIGLSLIDVRFALLFAVFSALLVVVPYFGAVAGGIPPVLFALTDSPQKALLVLGIYLLVQQVEGNLIVPLVMARTVKLHPAAIAVGVLIVAQLLGAIGLFVAVPIISTAVILTEELWVKPRERRRMTAIQVSEDAAPPAEQGDRGEDRARSQDASAPPEDAREPPEGESDGDAEGGREKLSWGQRRFLALLALPSLALALSITLVTTYLPVLIAELSGPAITGVLIGTEGLVALFVPLVTGSWSDRPLTRFGRRMPFLLLAAPVAAAALVVMPLVGSLLALVVLLLFFYGAYFAYYSPYYALYPDLVPDRFRGRSQGFQNTLREIGLGGALVGGGVLLGLWRPLPFLAAGLILLAVTAGFAWRIEEPEEVEEEPDGGTSILGRVRALVSEHRGLRWTAGATALWEFTLAALKTFVVLFFTVGLDRSPGFASIVLAIVAVAVIVAAVVGGKLADRFGHLRLIRMALWVYGLGLLVPLFWHEPWALAIVPPVAFAAGVVMTLPFSLMMGMMPPQSHGAAAGLYGFSRGVGVLLGPVIAGVAIELLRPLLESTEGYAAVFGVAAAGILLSIPVLGQVARESSERR